MWIWGIEQVCYNDGMGLSPISVAGGPGSYRPTARFLQPLPLLVPPIPVEPEVEMPTGYQGISQSPAGSGLSGSGYSLAAGQGREPWLEAVYAYCEELRQGAWPRALRRAGCPAQRLERLSALRRRLNLGLLDFTLHEEPRRESERALVTVFENLRVGQAEVSRTATFRVEYREGCWCIGGVEGEWLGAGPIHEGLMWGWLTGRVPRVLLEQGLAALLWAVGSSSDQGLAHWPAGLPRPGALSLNVRRSWRRWRPPMPAAWVDSELLG